MQHRQLVSIPTDQLAPGPWQPRTFFDEEYLASLAHSLKETGQLDPISVVAQENGPHLIVSGECRWRAAKIADLPELLAIIVEAPPIDLFTAALVPNEGMPLNPIETARAFKRLADEFSLTHQEIGERCALGASRFKVSRLIQLLDLPSLVQEEIATGILTPAHGRVLLQCPSQTIASIAQQCIENSWSIRELEKHISRLLAPPKRQPVRKAEDSKQQLQLMAQDLSSRLGLDTKIKSTGSKKRKIYTIQIVCQGDEQLKRFMSSN